MGLTRFDPHFSTPHRDWTLTRGSETAANLNSYLLAWFMGANWTHRGRIKMILTGNTISSGCFMPWIYWQQTGTRWHGENRCLIDEMRQRTNKTKSYITMKVPRRALGWQEEFHILRDMTPQGPPFSHPTIIPSRIKSAKARSSGGSKHDLARFSCGVRCVKSDFALRRRSGSP